MTKPIRILDHKEIRKILHDNDVRVVFDRTNVVPQECELYKHLKAYVDYRKFSSKAILGIDIFQYSSYGEFEQTLIPFLFKKMLHTTIELCLAHHPFIFQKYSREDYRETLYQHR